MPKVKVPRKSTLIDMTAMCDVAFLLLTFFMLTTQFKSDESVFVDLPKSISEIKLPETDILNITITKEGRVFFNIDNKNFARQRLLDKISQKYGIEFTPREQKAFDLTGSVGMPIGGLKDFLALDDYSRKNYPQPGIPIDSAHDELGTWLMQGRLSNPNVRITITGDRDCPWPIIKRVINTLQDKHVNKFNLITNLEANPNKPQQGI